MARQPPAGSSGRMGYGSLMRALWRNVQTWAEMIKFAHSVFALPFALMAAFLAGRHIEPLHRPLAGQLILVIVCMVSARSVAMTFNRIVDRRFDARNPRTSNRPLVTGRISLLAACWFLGLAAGAFLAGCAGFLWLYRNPWPVYLAVPVLVYLCGYSYTKRFTNLSHFYLGSAIALSPPAAWIAVHPASIGLPAVVLAAAVTLWIGGFDIIYACQDIPIDRRDGLFSLPARWGPAWALWVARAAHAATVGLLAGLAPLAGLGWLYLAGVAAVAVLLTIENLLVRADDLSRVNLAFFTINGLVSVGLGAMAILDVLLGPKPPAWG